MDLSIGLCDPEPVPFVVYVPHGNHPMWTIPNCSTDSTSCISIYRRRVVDMGESMTKNYRYSGSSTDTPQNWINMTMVIMCLSLLVMVVLIGAAFFSRVNRELKSDEKEGELDSKLVMWYQNGAAKWLSLLTAIQLNEKEEITKKD